MNLQNLEPLNIILQILKFIWPIILIQWGLQIYAIIDIVRKKKTRNLSVVAWILIVLFGELIGSIVYLLVGRVKD